MSVLSFVNQNVVITGAASGLGRELAKQMAIREKANIIIADRQYNRILELKAKIESLCDVKVHPINIDLASDHGPETLFTKATEIGLVSALINNAGIGFFGKTLEQPFEYYEPILRVNQLTVMKTTTMFLDYFLKHGGGAILNITSMGAFSPAPFQNVYAATKHAVQAFTEGLSFEYRNRGVTFCTFAPGGIATEMVASSGLDKHFGMSSLIFMQPDVTARLAIKALKKRKLVTIPGLFNKATIFMTRVVPRKFALLVAGSAYAPKKSKH